MFSLTISDRTLAFISTRIAVEAVPDHLQGAWTIQVPASVLTSIARHRRGDELNNETLERLFNLEPQHA